jgi:uncharacterized membrane protein YhiD involved in acid resistance
MNISEIGSLINSTDEISITTTVLSLIIGVLLSIAIRWHFRNYGSTLSNREEFSQVFPFILLTTLLIITVVKSSIALSLGLVGALSIVRFRTPIKEPEELAYLFISIAAGLGLGAGQIKLTVVSIITILLFMMILRIKWKKDDITGKNLFISIDIAHPDQFNKDEILSHINQILEKYARTSDIRRFDIRQESLEIVYLVDLNDIEVLSSIVKSIQSEYSDAGVTFIDQNNLPSI